MAFNRTTRDAGRLELAGDVDVVDPLLSGWRQRGDVVRRDREGRLRPLRAELAREGDQEAGP
jgi:hypothetical protein